MPRNWARTRAALAEYDRDAPVRDLLWEKAETDKEVETAVVADEAALQRVREAFADDTADINSRKTVLSCLTLDYARACVPA